MNQGQNITDENTAEFERGNAEYEAFINSGGKVITEMPVKKKKKGSINLKSAPKHHRDLEGMANIDKVEWLINRYKEITTTDIQSYAGIHSTEVFRFTRLLQDEGLISREKGKGMGAVTVFKWIGKKQ